MGRKSRKKLYKAHEVYNADIEEDIVETTNGQEDQNVIDNVSDITHLWKQHCSNENVQMCEKLFPLDLLEFMNSINA